MKAKTFKVIPKGSNAFTVTAADFQLVQAAVPIFRFTDGNGATVAELVASEVIAICDDEAIAR
jgi:hypothetical protein